MSRGFIPPTPPPQRPGPQGVVPAQRRRQRKRRVPLVLLALGAVALAVGTGVAFYVMRDPGGDGRDAGSPVGASRSGSTVAVAVGGNVDVGAGRATSERSTRPTTIPVWELPRPAPASGTPPVAELEPVFLRLTNAIAGKKGFLIETVFDPDRFVREIQSLGFLTDVADEKREELGETLVRQLARAFHESPGMTFRALDVRSVQPLPDPNEVVVCVRGTATGTTRVKYRFWLYKRPAGWKVYDFEDVDGGPRSTQAVAAAVAANASTFSAPPWAAYAVRFGAILTAIDQKEFDIAAQEIRRMDRVALPVQYEALRTIIKGILCAHGGDPAGAVKYYDRAQKLRPDLPGTHLLRAAAYNSAGEPERALAEVKRNFDLFGDDARAYFEAGRAYQRLARPELAAAAYELGLREDPASEENERALERLRNPPPPPPTTEVTSTTAATTAPATAPATRRGDNPAVAPPPPPPTTTTPPPPAPKAPVRLPILLPSTRELTLPK